jgi:hypothetical protein
LIAADNAILPIGSRSPGWHWFSTVIALTD